MSLLLRLGYGPMMKYEWDKEKSVHELSQTLFGHPDGQVMDGIDVKSVNLSNPNDVGRVAIKSMPFDGNFYDNSNIAIKITKPTKGLGVRDRGFLWPVDEKTGIVTVPYRFATKFPDDAAHQPYKQMVADAAAIIRRSLPFIDICAHDGKAVKGAIVVEWDTKVAAHVGYQPGVRNLFLATWAEIHNVVHELCHLLGLWHEHQRPDRDRYCMDLTAKVAEDSTNYGIIDPALARPIGLYDKYSIMHYPCQDGTQTYPTELTPGDIETLTHLYRPSTVTGCTYLTTGSSLHEEQRWYQCRTCWGEGPTAFGCCKACSTTCHDGHDIITVETPSHVFCCCGHNLHKRVCTSNNEHASRRQLMFDCKACSTSICKACSEVCHNGHVLAPIDTKSALCTCIRLVDSIAGYKRYDTCKISRSFCVDAAPIRTGGPTTAPSAASAAASTT